MKYTARTMLLLITGSIICGSFFFGQGVAAQWFDVRPNSIPVDFYDIGFAGQKGWAVGSRTGGNKIYVTTDQGSSWSLQCPPPYSWAIYGLSVVDETHAWTCGSSGHILGTTDGTTWSEQTTGTASNLRGICFVDTLTGWCVGTGIILGTTDGGTNWNTQLSGSFTFLTVDFIDSQTGWTGGYLGQIYRTSDGGTSWDTAGIISGTDIEDLVFLDSQNGYAAVSWAASGAVYRTTDGGDSWILLQTFPYNVWAIDAPNSNSIFISGTMGHVCWSNDAGLSWNDSGSLCPNLLSGLVATDSDTCSVAGHWGTLLKTADGGSSFQFGADSPGNSFREIDLYGENSIWFLGQGLLMRSHDSGISWDYRSVPIRTMDFISTTVGFGTSGLDIYQSSDSGASWGIIYSYPPPPMGNGELFSVYFVSDLIGWAMGGFEILDGLPPILLQTTDGGLSWINCRGRIPMVSDGEVVREAFFVDSLHGWINGGVYMGIGDDFILRTTDGGFSWFRTDLVDFHVSDMHFTSIKQGWIVQGGGSSQRAYTSDSGISWGLDLGQGGNSVFFVDDLNGYIVGGAGGSERIIATTDGGATWFAETDPHPATSADYCNSVCFSSGQRGWIVGDRGEVLSSLVLNPPYPVPNGQATTSPLRAEKSGTDVVITWDVGSCYFDPMEYNIYYGDLSGIQNYTLADSHCSVGTTGSYTWQNSPTDTFFLMVGVHHLTESSWGTTSSGLERNDTVTPAGWCGILSKVTSQTCP